MKNIYLKLWGLVLLLVCCVGALPAQDFVNLTPRPKTMTVQAGSLTLPERFAVRCTGLDEPTAAEVSRFVADLNAATGFSARIDDGANDAQLRVSMLPASSALKSGGYTLNVTATGVDLQGKDLLGVFYGLQSLKKMLPPNVMAGVPDESVKTYALPCVSITDEPRFAYRGFMLDVARHFFTVEEVKRMLDVMAYYKMNVFHWHLSDDQGWRVEIPKYPKLTTVGATAPNCRFTDMDECTQYWINKPYGPYFYTREEIQEVVAYAQARHIDIVPEIDMPGHFCAAMAAYPEFSCTPDGAHTVWSDGGISSDVLNVANPAAVQFCKDVLAELIDLFPYDYIHIGGDECPTTAWENNAECQAAYRELGLTSYRQLQSHFIKELSDFVKSKGRKLAIWNEGITASGADLALMRETGATVYCWTGAEAAVAKAAELGLPSIYTPWGPYYINRKQGSSETDPPGAGDGTDNVEKTYNTVPPPATSLGVQGTFWTEHVSDREYMEWLALPRLIAVAEAGWTTQANKDFEDFRRRMTADTTLLNYGGYRYCKYKMLTDGETEPTMVMPLVSNGEKQYYYRLVSGATDNARRDRCVELLADGSPLNTTYATNGAQPGRLWTNTQAAEGAENYAAQWWRLEEDAAHPGKYALVCLAAPEGSVSPTPTATSTAGRWTYDYSAKHYAFELGGAAYGKKGDNYYYSIASDQVAGQYLNSSLGGQGLAVNVYNNPNDGAGGQWAFVPQADYGQGEQPEPVPSVSLEEGKNYVFRNAVDGYDETAPADNGNGTRLQHSADAWAQNAWQVAEPVVNADGSQTFKLKNAATGRYVAAAGSYESLQGCPVALSDAAGARSLTLKYVADRDEYRLLLDDKSLFPLPAGYVNAGSTISGATYDAARGQGATWKVEEVRLVTFQCVDEAGASLGSFTRSIPAAAEEVTADDVPSLKNFSLVSLTATADDTYTATYKRSAYSIRYEGTDERGAIVADEEVTVAVGEKHTVSLPAPKYYTLVQADVTDGEELSPEADRTIRAVYATDAYTGVRRAADVVTKLEAGKSYLFYDAASDAARVGYRLIREADKKINRSLTDEGLLPAAVWTLEGSGNRFRVKNDYYGLYVPQLVRSTATTASATGDTFTFNLNADGTTWNIRGTNGQYWDGVESGDLVGWNGGTGHPIRISRFYAQPYFSVHVVCRDEAGTTLHENSTLVAAGSAYPLVLPALEGYDFVSATGNEAYDGTVEGHVSVVATYQATQQGIGGVTAEADGKQPSAIYDLQGRRLRSISRPGIYIVGGSKVLFR